MHAELDMQRAAEEKRLELPIFNLFGAGNEKE
jgi:hypothetical protein